MRKAGGVLTIVGGIIGVVGAISGIIMIVTGADLLVKDEAAFFTFAIVALIVGIVALIGGIYALRARVWGFALAGGIVLIGFGAGVFPGWFGVVGEYIGYAVMGIALTAFGILGTIFIALRKAEFE